MTPIQTIVQDLIASANGEPVLLLEMAVMGALLAWVVLLCLYTICYPTLWWCWGVVRWTWRVWPYRRQAAQVEWDAFRSYLTIVREHWRQVDNLTREAKLRQRQDGGRDG